MTNPSTTIVPIKPRVLENRPHTDARGNRGQLVGLLYICGHEEHFFSLNMGKGWKPRTNAQLVSDHLKITCPIAWKVCPSCADPTRYVLTAQGKAAIS